MFNANYNLVLFLCEGEIYVSLSYEYACSAWGSYIKTKRRRKRLRSIERSFNLMMTRSFRSVDSGSLSVLSGTLPIDYRVKEMIMRRYLTGGFQSFSPAALALVREELGTIGLAAQEHSSGDAILPPWCSDTVSPPDITNSSESADASSGHRLPSPPFSETDSFLIDNQPSQVGEDPVDPSGAEIKARVRRVLEKDWCEEWKKLEHGRSTRSFFPTPSCLGSLQKLSIHPKVVQVITGHSYLNGHLARIGTISNP